MYISDARKPSPLYRIIVVCLFLVLMGIVMGLVSPGISDTDLEVVGSQIHLPVILATSLLYLFILARLLTNRRQILWASRGIVSFAPIVVLCVVSAAWSTNPGLTIRRAIFLILTMIIGLILGTDFSVVELIRLLAVACLIHIALCLFCLFVAPSLLYSPSDPQSLKGFTTHKNIFGFEEGLALLAFLLVPFHRLCGLRIPLAVLAGVLLILSRSSGSLVATLCTLSLLPLLFVARFRGTDRIPIVLMAILLVSAASVLLYQNASIIPGLFSKDATLTGRTELWSLVLVAIGHHPLCGYGFDSFWQGLQGDSLTIIRGVGWLVPTAHNGYLDLLLGTGFAGALLFLPPLIQTISRAFRFLTIERSSAKSFPIAFIFFWLIYNLNESALLTRGGIPLLLFVSLSTALGIRISEYKVGGTVSSFYRLRQQVYGSSADFAPNQP